MDDEIEIEQFQEINDYERYKIIFYPKDKNGIKYSSCVENFYMTKGEAPTIEQVRNYKRWEFLFDENKRLRPLEDNLYFYKSHDIWPYPK